MTEKILKATHESDKLNLGDKTIPCAVLEDGTRILRERSVAKALGRKGADANWGKKKSEKDALLPEYVAVLDLELFIDSEIRGKLLNPVTYMIKSGSKVQGLPAELLPEICNIWLEAREKGALTQTQKKVAKNAEILMRAWTHVGIIALVDEATGYQETRDKQTLRVLLDKYLLEKDAKWAKRFPDEFYKEMFRLRGLEWKGISIKRPSMLGKYTKDLVYQRLAPEVLRELEKLNPEDDSGKIKSRQYQFLTPDIGHPALNQLIFALMGMMRASRNWGQFYRMVQQAFPKKATS